jgi:hypothetical protein
MMQGYDQYAGLSIAAELPIPDWVFFEWYQSAGDKDVRIGLDGGRLLQHDLYGVGTTSAYIVVPYIVVDKWRVHR